MIYKSLNIFYKSSAIFYKRIGIFYNRFYKKQKRFYKTFDRFYKTSNIVYNVWNFATQPIMHIKMPLQFNFSLRFQRKVRSTENRVIGQKIFLRHCGGSNLFVYYLFNHLIDFFQSFAFCKLFHIFAHLGKPHFVKRHFTDFII